MRRPPPRQRQHQHLERHPPPCHIMDNKHTLPHDPLRFCPPPRQHPLLNQPFSHLTATTITTTTTTLGRPIHMRKHRKHNNLTTEINPLRRMTHLFPPAAVLGLPIPLLPRIMIGFNRMRLRMHQRLHHPIPTITCNNHQHNNNNNNNKEPPPTHMHDPTCFRRQDRSKEVWTMLTINNNKHRLLSQTLNPTCSPLSPVHLPPWEGTAPNRHPRVWTISTMNHLCWKNWVSTWIIFGSKQRLSSFLRNASPEVIPLSSIHK